MWLKLVLLIIYVCLLFILARVLEAVSWVESGNLSRRLLDPMTMSVLQLKALLEQRGISYEGAVEKRELTELVEATGTVTGEDVSESEKEAVVSVTNFTGGAHFLEQVEDAKDSVWLVHVRTDQQRISPISDHNWKNLGKKVARFGVNMGVFDCTNDWRFCSRKGWRTSQLILGVPHDFQKKAFVTLYTYNGPYKLPSVQHWIKETLSAKTKDIRSLQEFQNWMEYDNFASPSEVRMIFFSSLDTTPILYSALSVKFPGRVRFGVVQIRTKVGKKILSKLTTESSPTYLIITSEKTVHYGKTSAERFTFRSMESFLSTLYPSINDVFVLSLVTCNLLCCFEPFLTKGSWIKRLVALVWCVAKYNMYLILIWISLLTIFQLNILSFFIELGLKSIRMLSLSTLGGTLRCDNDFYGQYYVITYFSFAVYLFLTGFLNHKLKRDESDEDANPNEWNFAQFRTLQYLFYPTASLVMPLRRNQWLYDLEESNQILEDFHTSRISNDYIKHLPTWPYKLITSVTGLNNKQGNLVIETIHSQGQNQSKDVCQNTTKNSYLKEKDRQGPIKTANFSEFMFQTQEASSADICASRASIPSESLSTCDSNLSCENFVSEKKRNIKIDQTDQKQLNSTSKEQGLGDNKAPVGMLEDKDCVICLDDYKEGVVLCGLPCGHCFHYTCLVAWLTRDNHICPICRWPADVPKSSIHLHSE